MKSALVPSVTPLFGHPILTRPFLISLGFGFDFLLRDPRRWSNIPTIHSQCCSFDCRRCLGLHIDHQLLRFRLQVLGVVHDGIRSWQLVQAELFSDKIRAVGDLNRLGVISYSKHQCIWFRPQVKPIHREG